LDIVEEPRQPAVVSSRGHEPVRHDHLERDEFALNRFGILESALF